MKPIPIVAARQIAEKYDYDQVVIIARKVGENGGEHCTTYGVDKENCDVAAKIGDFVKFKVMGWVCPTCSEPMNTTKACGDVFHLPSHPDYQDHVKFWKSEAYRLEATIKLLRDEALAAASPAGEGSQK